MKELALPLVCLAGGVAAIFTVVIGAVNGIAPSTIAFRAVVSIIVFAVLSFVCCSFFLKDTNEMSVQEEGDDNDTDYTLARLQEDELEHTDSKEESIMS